MQSSDWSDLSNKNYQLSLADFFLKALGIFSCICSWLSRRFMGGCPEAEGRGAREERAGGGGEGPEGTGAAGE